MILFFDDRGGFGPTFNATHAVGGAEMHLVQVAEFLAGAGHDVFAHVHLDDRELDEGGVLYLDSRRETTDGREVDTLIIVGCASLPRVTAKRVLAFQVVDPRPHPERFEHLKGRATMVCVSEWQAGLFHALGHEAIVIPVPIPDEWYDCHVPPVPGRHVCVASWNKGAEATVRMWNPAWGELAVGSPYSHPENAEFICKDRGVTWLGTLRPRERWIAAMRSGAAMARVCTIGETFGVTDVAARAMGVPAYTLCTGDVGSLREVGACVFTDAEEWRRAIREKWQIPSPVDVETFRASRVLPKWLEVIA